MLKHRCPWCGEREAADPHWYVRVDQCSHCKNYYELRGKRHRFEMDCLILVLLMIIVLRYSDLDYLIPLFPVLVLLAFIRFWQTPFQRHVEEVQQNQDQHETLNSKITAKVQIQWKDRCSKGLFLPRFQVQNGEIFPSYFLNTDGKLISSGLCVVLEEIKWTGRRQCNCEISFVLDDVSCEEYLKKENRFYLYYYKRKIAEGIVQ